MAISIYQAEGGNTAAPSPSYSLKKEATVAEEEGGK